MTDSATYEPLMLAFYGDDLTGSTDALESLVLSGIETALFLDTPDAAALSRHPGVRAVGVAGATRGMRTQEMESVLRSAFLRLRSLHPRHVHYKVCSTYDSSSEIGSIGRAIDVGAEIFQPAFVPVVGGAPSLGRYCIFGNLFASVGIGGGGAVHRLDRHPAMIRHPVTPAKESDLCILLGSQTKRRLERFDVLKLELPAAEARAALDRMVSGGAEAVLFDAANAGHVKRIGELAEESASEKMPLYWVGPSSVERALAARWPVGATGLARSGQESAGTGGPILVASGSGSPVTGRQIERAVEAGFGSVPLDTRSAIEGSESRFLDTAAVAAAIKLLASGKNVVLHTSCGPSDSRIAAAREWAGRREMGLDAFTERLGALIGRAVREIVGAAKPRRVVLAGGDSSSHAARALGIESLTMIGTLTPGAPLCRAFAPDSPFDRVEVVFKGGQVGGEDYFIQIAS